MFTLLALIRISSGKMQEKLRTILKLRLLTFPSSFSPVSLADYHGWADSQVHGFANVPRSKPLDLVVPHLNMIIFGHQNDNDDDDAGDDDGNHDDFDEIWWSNLSSSKIGDNHVSVSEHFAVGRKSWIFPKPP